jgi:hypothetical protein
MQVIVPSDQLSLAIGKRGQNVRLAAKLTHWKIDIVGEEESASDLERQEALRRAELAFGLPRPAPDDAAPAADALPVAPSPDNAEGMAATEDTTPGEESVVEPTPETTPETVATLSPTEQDTMNTLDAPSPLAAEDPRRLESLESSEEG